MIICINHNPLEYVNEKGEPLEVKEVTCPVHGNQVKYVVDGSEKVLVQAPGEELGCEAWKNVEE
ncbi:MAG: hypothetical protein DRJ03_07255 [Chloroflexi bacterium]|nr:MAG: hypothetical protein DRJ03_07255 [Chloroflexota bacterium]